MSANVAFGRDRRRRLSSEEAAELFERAKGRCERCGQPLGVTWQQAHLAAFANGGATSLANMQAWCRDCNLRQGALDVQASQLEPRAWQAAALNQILERLWETGAATVHAAPGAGKTFFAGLVFRHLAAAGLAERMVVVVPNRALQQQWAEALGALRVHLDWQPRDNFLEHPQTVGSVVTYQGLTSAANGHVSRMQAAATLFVLDEVHHVGDQKAWGNAVARIVGSNSPSEIVNPAGVLNMTGTLFRSGKSQRISTVRYDEVEIDGEPKFQAVADFSVPASELIGIELRRPDLYAYTGQVELVDVREEMVIEGSIADLEAGSQVNTAVRAGFLQRALVHDFARESLRLLSQQLLTINDREPLKLLWVAEDIKSARLAAEEIDKAANRQFARLITSDQSTAMADLRKAARDPQPCAIVAVRMVTEGFDCPQVSVIAYASATTAVLFLAQTMARAMRVTSTERADRMLLPAQILIPNNPALRQAFAEALVGHFHILEIPEEATETATATGFGDAVRMPRYELANISVLDLHSATVLGEDDGTVSVEELNAAIAVCLDVSIPEVFAARVAVASRKMETKLPLYTVKDAPKVVASSAATPLTAKAADPRTVNKARRGRIAQVSGWMNHHFDHDSRFESIGAFQGEANSNAGISAGGRDQASADQLRLVEEWMVQKVQEHCSHHGCPLPRALRSIDHE